MHLDGKKIAESYLKGDERKVSNNSKDSQGKVDVNHDTEEKIAELEGIGPLLAKKAVEIRNSVGKFKSKDDFFEKLELKPHIVSEIEDKIVCDEKEEKKPKTTHTGTRLFDS